MENATPNAPESFDDQLTRLIATRPHYSVTCNTCGKEKHFFPHNADETEMKERQAKKQRNFTCDTDACRKGKTETATDAPSTESKPKTVVKVAKVAASGKLKVSDMLAQGKIKAGDFVTVAKSKHGDSTATIIDAKTVKVVSDNAILSWNDYGKRFTGHKEVNVYKHVMYNGALLQTLR